ARQRPDVPDAGPRVVRSAASFRGPYRLRRSHGGAALARGACLSPLRAEGRSPDIVVVQYRWALGPRLRQYLLDQGSGRPRLFGRVLLSRRDQRARHGGGPRDDIHVPAPLAQTASLISRLTATKASGLAAVPVKKLNRFMGLWAGRAKVAQVGRSVGASLSAVGGMSTAFGHFGRCYSWRRPKTVGKRYQPLKRQGVPQQQGRGNEKADNDPLRKCSPTREDVGQGAHKRREEVGHGTDKPFEKPFERIVGPGPSKH